MLSPCACPKIHLKKENEKKYWITDELKAHCKTQKWYFFLQLDLFFKKNKTIFIWKSYREERQGELSDQLIDKELQQLELSCPKARISSSGLSHGCWCPRTWAFLHCLSRTSAGSWVRREQQYTSWYNASATGEGLAYYAMAPAPI